MKALAVIYQAAGQIDAALELAKLTFDFRQATLGDDHPDTLIAMDLLQDVQLNREDYAEAEALARVWLTVLDHMPEKEGDKKARARQRWPTPSWGKKRPRRRRQKRVSLSTYSEIPSGLLLTHFALNACLELPSRNNKSGTKRNRSWSTRTINCGAT